MVWLMRQTRFVRLRPQDRCRLLSLFASKISFFTEEIQNTRSLGTTEYNVAPFFLWGSKKPVSDRKWRAIVLMCQSPTSLLRAATDKETFSYLILNAHRGSFGC
ncbi:hypothetical protein CPSG_06170 [Coccidioides posadasii str. Silveira]|uniref:Uncharacterized protein n=1 Tax=Coccidioides posadasii (strain RMSCC 757 / Silveira) TaxID=443226 RepID=E9D8L8_COCPS|nr:hypothetical protein CPSG_06170 [Coccidioides posadasii str. Silveira]